MLAGKTASEIFDNIRHLVQSGGLQPGEVLPPVRELASQLAVNRNTVAAAYKRLVTSGLAVSQGRNGTAIKARDTLPALEGGDPTTPLNDISSGNPDPARLPDLPRYLGQIARTPRLYGDAPIEPRLGQWAEAWFAREIAVPFAVNLASGAIDAWAPAVRSAAPRRRRCGGRSLFSQQHQYGALRRFYPARWRWMPKGWILTAWRRRYATEHGR